MSTINNGLPQNGATAPVPAVAPSNPPLAVPEDQTTSLTIQRSTDIVSTANANPIIPTSVTTELTSEPSSITSAQSVTSAIPQGESSISSVTSIVQEPTTQAASSEPIISTTIPSSIQTTTAPSSESTSTVMKVPTFTATLQTTTSPSSVSTRSTTSKESSIVATSTASSQSIPPVPPPVPLFTSSTSSTYEVSSSTSAWSSYEPSPTSSWDSATSLPASALNVAHLEVDSSSVSASTTDSATEAVSSTSAPSAMSSASTDTSSETVRSDANPDQSASTDNASATSLTGADSAQSNSNPDTKSDGEGKMSSIAIVGIVGGVLVGLVLLYLGWYQWRKKRAREALFGLDDDEMNEKFSDTMYQNRITRSSFGAADPITPYVHRQKNGSEAYNQQPDEEDYWYDPSDMQRVREHDERIRQFQHEHANPFEDNIFDPTKTALPTDGQTNYTTDYGYDDDDEMGASLAEDHSPELLHRSNSNRSQMGGVNPFVPPVPPFPNSYGLNRNETIRTVRTIPAVPDDVDPGYETSIYDQYTTSNSRPPSTRPQSEYTEPPTSNLLPWINKGLNPQSQDDTPPVPTIIPNQIARNVSTKRLVVEPELDNINEPIRQPPRAMMNQVPIREIPKGHGGELAEIPIPTFR